MASATSEGKHVRNDNVERDAEVDATSFPADRPASTPAHSTALKVNRWRRYGKDRLYVVGDEGVNVGWIDLLTGTKVLEQADERAAFERALTAWLLEHPDVAVPDAVRAVPAVDPVRAPAPLPTAQPSRGSAAVISAEPELVLPERMVARFDGACAACGDATPKGTVIYWSKVARVAVCPGCMAYEGRDRGPGRAGGGAQEIADRAAVKHAAKVRAAFPELADAIVELNRAPNHVHSWAAGADGERVVGRTLDRIAAKRGNLLVLHDRLIPETGGNIDHLVVGPKRVGVLDAKNYRGKKVRVPRDGDDDAGRRLFIDGRDCTQLAADVRLQAARVSEVVAAIVGPEFLAQPYLVFVNAKFGLTGSPKVRTRGVWCLPPDEAAAHVAYRGPIVGESFTFDACRREEIRAALAERFPAAVP